MRARGGGVPRQLTLRGFGPSPVGLPVEAELARLRVKVVVDPRPGGCHHWVGAIGGDGYGRFQAGSGPGARTVRPHVRLFELTYGLRPVGVPLLHSCDETGWDQPAFDAAVAGGDPFNGQLTLPIDTAR